MTSEMSPQPLRASPIYGQNAIVSPSVPFNGAIRRLHVGESIIIKGLVLSRTSGFTIELELALPNGQFEKILHVSVRLERKEIVRNTMLSGKWGPEERFGGMGNLHRGEKFDCILLVQEHRFRIAFNKEHFCDYRHRTNYGSINRLSINGGIQLHSIHFQAGPGSRMMKGVANAMPMVVPQQTGDRHGKVMEFPCEYNISLPYFEYIPGGMVPNRYLYICGKMLRKARRFQFNLLVGSSRKSHDIALHCDVRFDDPDTHDHENVVCNTYFYKKWGPEQRLDCDFPFERGVHFDLLIAVESTSFKISANNEHLVTFTHRWTELDKIKGVSMDGDAKIIHTRLH